MTHLPRISELGTENVKNSSLDGVKFRSHENEAGFDSSRLNGYSFISWNDSASDASHPSEVKNVPFLN